MARARSNSSATVVRARRRLSDEGPDPLLPVPILAGRSAREIPMAANSAGTHSFPPPFFHLFPTYPPTTAAIGGCSGAMGSEQQPAAAAASMACEQKELAALARGRKLGTKATAVRGEKTTAAAMAAHGRKAAAVRGDKSVTTAKVRRPYPCLWPIHH